MSLTRSGFLSRPSFSTLYEPEPNRSSLLPSHSYFSSHTPLVFDYIAHDWFLEQARAPALVFVAFVEQAYVARQQDCLGAQPCFRAQSCSSCRRWT